HHATAWADAMNRHRVLAGGRHDRLHRARSLARRDLDAVLPAVVEALSRGWQVVSVPAAQLQVPEDCVGGPHPPDNTTATGVQYAEDDDRCPRVRCGRG